MPKIDKMITEILWINKDLRFGTLKVSPEIITLD